MREAYNSVRTFWRKLLDVCHNQGFFLPGWAQLLRMLYADHTWKVCPEEVGVAELADIGAPDGVDRLPLLNWRLGSCLG